MPSQLCDDHTMLGCSGNIFSLEPIVATTYSPHVHSLADLRCLNTSTSLAFAGAPFVLSMAPNGVSFIRSGEHQISMS
jgi:hypothetical protein